MGFEKVIHSENYRSEISQPFIKTSLIEVTNDLKTRPPCRIFFKNEYEQPSGSFKLRGISNLIEKSVTYAKKTFPQKQCHVYASSGGNAGLAAAYSARYYRVKCTVVLPVVSKMEVRDKLKEYGAEIIVHGANIHEADQYVRGLINNIDTNKVHSIYCHPFDNPLIWDGHASIIDEIFQNQLSVEQASNTRGIVCSIGGGGLYNGICKGLKNNKVKSDVLLIETNQAPTCRETIKADKIITLKSVNSVATSLACSYLSSESLANIKDQSKIKTFVESIDDFESIKGCVDYYDNFRHIVEPACGASISVAYDQVSLLYKNFENLKPDDIIIIVVCGGSCTNGQGIKEFKKLVQRKKNKL